MSVEKTSDNRRTNARSQNQTKHLNIFGTEYPNAQVARKCPGSFTII